MLTPETPSMPAAAEPPRAAPVVTYAVIAVCTVVFLLFNVVKGQGAQLLNDALVPSNLQIWRGAVWGLATSAFVHVALWHLAFNMIWARDFGRLIEPDMRAAPYFGFVVVTAIVSSGWQLLVSGTTGIGFSGVVYALFGYALARLGSRPAYRAFVTPQTVAWMLGWLVVCMILTWTGTWSVGNAAHVSGLASGYLLGFYLDRPRARRFAIAGGAVMAAGVVLSCTYMPWSSDWQARDWLQWFDTQRRQAEAGDAHSQAHYGSALMTWPEARRDGINWLRRAAESGNPEGMNGLAWWLAVAREREFRDGAEAVRWAEKAYHADSSPEIADTLAAAYAEEGRWDEAIATQERALAAVEAGHEPGHEAREKEHEQEPERAKTFRDRLERYRRHESWRE